MRSKSGYTMKGLAFNEYGNLEITNLLWVKP